MMNGLAGVIGWPVSHSLSPRMHRFWLNEHKVSGSYIALPVRQPNLSGTLKSLQSAGFRGVNLTLPHKEAGYALAHTADATAHASQAANLLLFRHQEFDARNTDVEGLVGSLRSSLGEKTGHIGQVVVLGAGGAARAAVLACDRLKVPRICVLSRTRARADTLVRALGKSVAAGLAALEWEAWQRLAPESHLLINATSGGLNGTDSPDVSLERIPDSVVVCDLVYSPQETPLLAQARMRGLVVVDGLGMLMHQGALAFELFFGVRPNVSPALRGHLEQALHDGL